MPISINCPNCRSVVRSPNELIGKRVQCPKCSTIFRVEDPNAGVEVVEDIEVVDDEPAPHPRRRPRPVDEDDEKPRRRRPRDDDYDDDDDFDDRPRRGNRRARAESAVKAPAITMMVIGSLGLAAAIVGNIINLLRPKPPLPPGAEAMEGYLQFVQILGFIVPVVWGIVVTYGAYKFRRLENYSSVMLAVIFSMLPCNIGCIAGIPVGIWALVVMNSPDVKPSFRG